MNHLRRAGPFLTLLMLATSTAPARAGDPFVVTPECQQLSLSPPRFRLEFWIVDTHAFETLCGVRVAPISWNGVAAQPVLDASGPAPFTFAIDSTGAATFGLEPCVPWAFYRYFHLVVSAAPRTSRRTC